MACAYNLHSLLLHITISEAQPHSHTWTHGIPLMGGCGNFCVSHSEVNHIQNSSTSQLLSPWRQPDVVQCTSPPLHMQASPEGRVKRHLLLFPPAAAENNQAETKSQATQRRSQETVPKGIGNSEHVHSVCTHRFALSIKPMSAPNLYPLRCT